MPPEATRTAVPARGGPLPARHALRVDVERVHGLARGHEEPIAPDPAEAQVRASLGERDAADELAGRIPNGHAVLLLAAAPAAPEVAVAVGPHPVGNSFPAIDEDASVGELRSFHDIEDPDLARLGAAHHHVELRLVGREAEPVWPRYRVSRDRQLSRPGIDPVDVRRELGWRRVALVVAEDAEWRIGEPDRAVRLTENVVGRVERRALIAVGQHGDRAVVLGSRHAPRIVL